MRVEDTAEMLLFRAIVLTAARSFEVQRVTVEVEDCDAVSETAIAVWSIPRKSSMEGTCHFACPFPWRKVNQFEIMPVGIAKVEAEMPAASLFHAGRVCGTLETKRAVRRAPLA